MNINSETVYKSMTDIGKLLITQEEFTKRLNKLYNNILINIPNNTYSIKNIYSKILTDIKIPYLDKKQLKNEEFKEEYM
jgi:hypothetical protein